MEERGPPFFSLGDCCVTGQFEEEEQGRGREARKARKCQCACKDALRKVATPANTREDDDEEEEEAAEERPAWTEEWTCAWMARSKTHILSWTHERPSKLRPSIQLPRPVLGAHGLSLTE